MKQINSISEFIDHLYTAKEELQEDKDDTLMISDIEVTIPINTNQIVDNTNVSRFFEVISQNIHIKDLYFENCIFNEFIAKILNEYTFNFIFENCTFKKFNIYGLREGKYYNLAFYIDNSNIEDLSINYINASIDISYSTFNRLNLYSLNSEYIHISNCTCNYQLELGKLKSNKINLENSTFEEVSKIDDIIVKELILKDCMSNKEDAFFSISNIDGEIHIEGSKFLSIVDFSNNIFKMMFEIQNTNFKKLSFKDSHFKNKLNIIESNLGEIDMSNCHFNDTVKLALNTYNSYLNLSYSIFKSVFIIDSDLFDVRGDVIKLKNEISFKKSLITNNALIIIRNVNSDDEEYNGTINFNSTNVLGTISLQNIKLENLDLENSTITGNINFEDVDFKEGNRKTYLKVKNELLKQNNKIDSLNYKSKELNDYLKEMDVKSEFCNNLYNSNKKSDWIKGVILLPILLIIALCKKQSREVILLYINKLSNSFGQSWVRGVFFTIFVWIFYFTLYKIMGCYIYFDIDYIDQTLGEALSYFWLFGGLDEIKDKDMNFDISLFEIVPYLLGKIFIAFGIYQTIAAFRKYGSK